MIRYSQVQRQLSGSLRSWPRFPLHISQRKLLLLGADLFLLNVSLGLGLHFGAELRLGYANLPLYVLWLAPLNLLWLLISATNDNYNVKQAANLASSTFGILQSVIIMAMVCILLLLISPVFITGWSTILIMGIAAAVLLTIWRILYATILVRPGFQRRALIVGAGSSGRAIAGIIQEHNPGYQVVGFVASDAADQAQTINGLSVSGEWSTLAAFVQDQGVSDLILASRDDLREDQLQIVLKCFEQGVRIVPMPVLFEEITGRIPVEHISDRWLVSLPIDWDSRRLYMGIKRTMDIVISGIGLLLLAPFLPLLALAIKLDSPGPVFYRPERLGRGGKPFHLWKFRTMVSDADRIGDPTFTSKNDQRITRVGRILRLIHVDELPQFINILSGEMSIVGPRPERFVPELEENIPYYRTRYAVKPGATGLALVEQGYAEGIDGTLIKLQYDLYYIKHQSLSFDILIMCKSVKHMLTMGGR